ncbi:MAG: divalent-cation tolerance protein CutA [Aquabacterium sp.]|nr:MAG: divalent-cation tolerance protein CutA [Aquabacterium sp.]
MNPPAPSQVLIALSTAPDEAAATAIARAVVEARVAACVNIVPQLRSIYRWRGQVEEAGEWLLLIKTAADRRTDLQRVLDELHPYEVPELVFIDVVDGLPAYLRWVLDETRDGTPCTAA